MKKRLLLILLTVCLAITCFAACGKDEDSGKATSKPTPSATAKATKAATATPAPKETATATATAAATPDAGKTAAPIEAGDAKVFRFDSEEDYNNQTGAFAYKLGKQKMLGNIKVSDDDGLILPILGNDPYVYYSGFEPFDLSEYPYMKICIQNPTPQSIFEVFIVPEGMGEASGGDVFTGGPITEEDSEFKTYVFDIKGEMGESYMDRMVEMLRLDCVQLTEGDTDYIFNLKYIGFFKTEAEANAYN